MAIKNIRTRRLRAWLTVIGIFIGIMAVVALIGLGEGLSVAISSQFGAFGPDIIRVSATGVGSGPPGTGVTIPLETSYVLSVNSLKQVESAAGRNLDYTTIRFNDRISFGAVFSVPEQSKERDLVIDSVSVVIQKGRMLKSSDIGKVVLGSSISDSEKFDKEIRIGSRVRINDKAFEVVGILRKEGSFMTDSMIIMNERDSRNLFDRNDGTYDIIIARYNENVYTIDESQEAIEKTMRRLRDVDIGEEDFEVTNPQAVLDNLNSTLFAVQLFVYIIAGISILVGGIGIMTTMFTSVVERTRDIGIMKSIGATNSTIFYIFFIESGFLGLVGGIVGSVLGYVIAKGLAKMGSMALGSDLIRAEISIYLILGTLLFSFILGTIFGTFPALKAAKMHPVDALNHVK